MSWISRTGLVAGIVATPSAPAAYGQVRRPSTGHAAHNDIPFHGASGQNCTMHQVFNSTLWSGLMEIFAWASGRGTATTGRPARATSSSDSATPAKSSGRARRSGSTAFWRTTRAA